MNDPRALTRLCRGGPTTFHLYGAPWFSPTWRETLTDGSLLMSPRSAILSTTRTSGGDDDLAAGVAVSEVADRLWNLVEWERPVDDRRDGAGFEQLPQLFQVLAALL